ncbi:AmmeMemoRadiSam system protein B [bacterium]|nr:AmmeMemoRadiSam system protein B [bacterium]
MNIRRPAVAGQFYPGDAHRLVNEIKRLVNPNLSKQKAIGIVSPHAGYMYSGQVAGITFSSIEIPETAIILGPNHTGYGHEASIMDEGTWVMPMGDVEIDNELARSILENSDVIQPDTLAHQAEHSLEVQIPFIQYLQPKIKIVPIVIGGFGFPLCHSVAKDIASGIKSQNKDVLIVASTDLSHYVSQSTANQKDMKVIEKIEALDAKGLLDMVANERISMCGFMPVATMILAAKELGAKQARLIKYMTSGDVTGDYGHVVGYAGLIVN